MKAKLLARTVLLTAINVLLPKFSIHYSLEAEGKRNMNCVTAAGIDQGLGALIWSPLALVVYSAENIPARCKPVTEGRFAAGWTEPLLTGFRSPVE